MRMINEKIHQGKALGVHFSCVKYYVLPQLEKGNCQGRAMWWSPTPSASKESLIFHLWLVWHQKGSRTNPRRHRTSQWQSHGNRLQNWQHSPSLGVFKVITGCPGQVNSDSFWQREEAEVPLAAEHLQCSIALPQPCTEASSSSRPGLSKEQFLLRCPEEYWFVKA